MQSGAPGIAGYVKRLGPLTQVSHEQRLQSAVCQPAECSCVQVTVRNAGHLLPHDAPLAARSMIETWVAGVLSPSGPAWATGVRQH